MAAKGNNIIVSGEPKGVRLEGLIATGRTPKPGTVMALTNAAPVSGNFTYEEFGVTAASSNNGVAADGDRRPIFVLLPDSNQGKDATTAYAAGDKCFLYCPVMGETLNMLFQNISGTGADQDVAIGDQLIVDDGTGKLLVAGGSEQSEPFQALDTLTDVEADVLLWCLFTGY